jgi:hypothetical protein
MRYYYFFKAFGERDMKEWERDRLTEGLTVFCRVGTMRAAMGKQQCRIFYPFNLISYREDEGMAFLIT